jgi:diguanylate cyclase (GGDEF)-like protein
MTVSTAPTSRKLLPVLGVFLVGLLLTAFATQRAATSRDQARQESAEVAADRSAARISVALEQAVEASQSFISPTKRSWPTSGEYTALWTSVRNALPGDSAAQTIVQIPAADVAALIAAEQQSNPDFGLQFLNPLPPDGGHLITLRASELQATSVGVDLSGFEGASNRLEQAQPGAPSYNGSDWREPGVATVPGQVQIVLAHEVPAASGGIYNAWTVVQVDIDALVDSAFDRPLDIYGLTLTSPLNPELTSLGVQPDDAIATSRQSASTRDLELAVEVRTNGTDIDAMAPQQVLAAGTALSGLAALLVAAALLLMSLMRRVDRSEHLARLDELTSLPNRRWLLEYLDHSEHPEVALLFCDLDRFKVVNDSAGHTIGDDLLQGVARRITTTLDSKHPVARFGGDEFIIVCAPEPGETALESGERTAQQLVGAMAEPFDLGTTTFRASLSIGVAVGATSDEVAVDELIRQADAALGVCKRNGRNGFRLYDTDMRAAEVDRLELEQSLQVALDRGELTVHYQPLFDAAQQIYSFEALVRWERDGSLIPPGVFLPVVEELGRMADVGAIVMESAVAQLAAWLEQGRFTADLTMHINIDAAELTAPSLPDRVNSLLQTYGVDASQLVLEVTEDKWLDITGDNQSVFRRLAALGVGIAIDDFGTGYSSISRILDIHGLTELKIDRSLVCRMDEPAGRALVAGMVEISNTLGFHLVAEGVETIEEHRALLAAGITRFQGFLFARPSAAELIELPAANPLDAASPDLSPVET